MEEPGGQNHPNQVEVVQGQQQEQAPVIQQRAAAMGYDAMMAVVSGDSDGGDLSDEDEILISSNHNNNNGQLDYQQQQEDDHEGHDLLYDEHLDNEDEAYVYMNLRGGQHTPNEQPPQPSSSSEALPGHRTPPKYTKPRNSDAVLSCPCCFNLLSMDTQQHYKYKNQFRAMFVMGISVDWQYRLIYDDKTQGLVRWDPPLLAAPNKNHDSHETHNNASNSHNQSTIVPDHPFAGDQDDENVIYYKVSCANCHTQVAALDMNDEVYHFYDCLASS